MNKARKALAAVAAGAAAATIAFVPGAQAASSSQQYVTVTNQNGVVRVGTSLPGQPLFGASIDTNTGTVCVGFSYQIPFCASAGIGPISTTAAAQPLPVYVDADDSDGVVGAGARIGTGSLFGVSYSKVTGQACAGVGMQRPTCVQLA